MGLLCVSTDFCSLVALTESSAYAICQSLLRHLLMALEVKGCGQSQMLICLSSGSSTAYLSMDLKQWRYEWSSEKPMWARPT